MAKVRFRIKDAYKNGNAPIDLMLEFNKERIYHLTGFTIPPQYWDNQTQRAKKVKAFHYSEFNKSLQDLETKVQRRLQELYNNLGRFPTKEETKKELNILTNRNPVKVVTLFEFLEKLTIERKNDRDSKGLSTSLNTLLSHLKEYCTTQRRANLNFSDITYNFFNSFKNFAYEVKDLSPNTFDKYIRLIKTSMREAQKRGLHQNTDYQNFSVQKVPTYGIYLNESELKRIYELDLSDKKGHEIVRDLFIIGCFTGGQRFSDWAKLKPENMFVDKGKQFLKYVSRKTEIEAVLPLNHTYVRAILDKYNGVLPNPLSNPKSNEYLKDIGQMANIATPTKDISHKKNIKTEKTVPKYDLITTHTARRSFATNLANSGVPLHEIRLLTGHTTEKNLQQYLKTSSYENALKVSKNDFFDNAKTE